MDVDSLRNHGVPEFFIKYLKDSSISTLNPAQIKAIGKGILDGKSMLACTPTGSGKTAIATMAIAKCLSGETGSKAVYLVPLKALANEKFKDFKKAFHGFKVTLSTGDMDSGSDWLGEYDIIVLTVEKMDSLLRHHCPWLKDVRILVSDEVHLLNDTSRGPTLEILLTMLRERSKELQIIALSATIGNADELAEWLNAELVVDDWRPVKLYQGTYLEGEIVFK